MKAAKAFIKNPLSRESVAHFGEGSAGEFFAEVSALEYARARQPDLYREVASQQHRAFATDLALRFVERFPAAKRNKIMRELLESRISFILDAEAFLLAKGLK